MNDNSLTVAWQR